MEAWGCGAGDEAWGRGKHLVPGQVHSEATALPPPNGICIRLPKIWPKATMLIPVPGEVKNTADNQPRSDVGAQGSGPQPHGSQQGVAGKAGDPSSPGVILKDVLGALTVVDIPVDNEDPADR